MIPQHGFIQSPNVQYHMGPPPHSRPPGRFDQPPRARPDFMPSLPGRPIPPGHMLYPEHSGPHPLPMRMGGPMGRPMSGPIAQHNRFIPPSGVNLNQRPPHSGFPGQAFPRPMAANRNMPHGPREGGRPAPGFDEQGVSGVDDAMEIEESGVTLESDIPVDKKTSRDSKLRDKKTSGDSKLDTNAKATTPAEDQVHTSQSEEPLSEEPVCPLSEATSSGGEAGGATAADTHPSSPSDTAVMEESNDSDSEGNPPTGAEADPNQRDDAVLCENDQSTLSQAEEELQCCTSTEDGDSQHPPASDSVLGEHRLASDHPPAPGDNPIEAVPDTRTSGEY